MSMIAKHVARIAAAAALLAVTSGLVTTAKASANSAGGGYHNVLVDCNPGSFTVDVVAGGSYYGQLVKAKMYWRAPGGGWQPLPRDWHGARVTSTTNSDAFGMFSGNNGTVTVDSATFYGNGAYAIGVWIYWWNGQAWSDGDFFVPDSYYQLGVSIYGSSQYFANAWCNT